MDAFWDEYSAFFMQLQRHFNTNDVLLADRLATRGYDYLHVASVIRCRVYQSVTVTAANDDIGSQTMFQQVLADLDIVVNETSFLVQHFESIGTGARNGSDIGEPLHVSQEIIRTGSPGRPSYVISSAQIEAMTALGLNYEQMSRILVAHYVAIVNCWECQSVKTPTQTYRRRHWMH